MIFQIEISTEDLFVTETYLLPKTYFWEYYEDLFVTEVLHTTR